MKTKFTVTGMTCSSCSAHVDKAVSSIAGVTSCNVNLLTNSMDVDFDENATSINNISDAVKAAGYSATPQHAQEQENPTAVDDTHKRIKLRLIISIIFMLPLFYLSMGSMIGLPVPTALSPHQNVIPFALTQLLLSIPILWVNFEYFTNGFTALFRRVPNMNSLIAIGCTAAMLYSIATLYQVSYSNAHVDPHSLHFYFESAAMILTLITVGKFLEARAKGKTSEAISKLMELAPQVATVLRDGEEVTIPTRDVNSGDIVVVKAGGTIPVDGSIVEGEGYADEAAITGESIPVLKLTDNPVTGGTILKSGYIHLKATAVGSDSTLSRIIQLVEEASSSKAEISKLADRVSRIFVPIVIAIATITFIVWLALGQGIEMAMSTAIAVLVISCPCALGLATPTAIMVGTGKGAQHGILIKSAHSLEVLHEVSTVVLDKTGTITSGKPQVTDVLPQNGFTENQLLTIAYAIEQRSEHPLAQAVLTHCNSMGLQSPTVSDYRTHSGAGVDAFIDGEQYYAGNAKWLNELGITVVDTDDLSHAGKTPLYFASSKQLIGIIAVMDTIKPSSKTAIARMKSMGLSTLMLTGDNPQTAEAIRKAVGIDKVIASVMPDQKEAHIRSLMNEGKRVAMIGDGINDSPALAAADVGIAIGAGTDIAIEAADMVLMRSDLMDAVTCIALSKATIRNIKQNLFWALFYNSLGIPLAAGVFHFWGITLDPMFAAAAMSLSSLFVVGNALRLRLFKPIKFIEENLEDIKMDSNKNNPQVESTIPAIETKVIQVEGMMCGHCQGRVEAALSAIPNLSDVVVDLSAKTATVKTNVSEDVLIKAIVDAGYKAFL